MSDPPREEREGTGGPPSSNPTPAAAAQAEAAVPVAPTSPDLGPVFIDRVPPQRSSFSSLMTMLFLIFFMSSGNSPAHPIEIGDDGEIRPRVTELERVRGMIGEYRGYLNGTGNWTEPPAPDLMPSAIIPPRHAHAHAHSGPFFHNITGWYRHASVTTVDLRAREPVPSPPDSTFFAGTTLPSVNTTDGSWNETRAAELRGQFPWGHVQWCDVNVRERWVTGVDVGKKKDKGKGKGAEKDKDKDGDKDKGDENDKDKDAAANVDGIGFIDLHPEDPPLLPTAWAWVRGSTTLTAHLPGYPADEGNEAITYDFYGLHFLANGTYELYALPEGTFLDIRNIPRLFPNHHNITSHIVLAELEKELRAYEGNLLLTDVKPDEPRASSCPLLIHLSVPPIPPGVTQAELQAYEAELANPTGILSSMTRPPAYWNSRPGMGGVIIADQCGFAYGIEHGKGMGIEEFWSKSLNYAAYATISQFIVLILLVRQMEATRTPSTLAKVSLWTIVLIGVSDVWLFSLHLGVGVMSNNKTSLPIIVPGFCVLCTSIVFAPRYAILLHRIQAPENTATPRPITSGTGTSPTDATGGGASGSTDEVVSFREHVGNMISANPIVKWAALALITLVLINVLRTPQVLPFMFFVMHSVWVPQIWRNARRGTARGLNPSFILGMSVARLALPLYGLGCPDNIFSLERADWVWALAAWVAVQVCILFAQDRFGPAFFLPKQFAPQQGYDYHPLIPSDPESVVGLGQGGSTCSICMEEVDVRGAGAGSAGAGSGTSADDASASSALLGMNARRSYAVAPCHHLFHTKCLQQWMAIKTICPLCKRPLPPL